jgi:hypothetical protein
VTLQYPNPAVGSSLPIIEARSLCRRKLTTGQRLNLALDVIDGKIALKPTRQSIALACGVSVSAISRARGGTRKLTSDEQVDRFIARHGVDAIWAGLDRLAKPQFAFVAAE